MKSILTFITFFFITTWCFGQFDKNGNPIFNSIELEHEEVDDYTISYSYFTIDNNINNSNSSVFVQENPTAEEYFTFSRDLPSYGIIVHKNGDVLTSILLNQDNKTNVAKFTFEVINPNNGHNITVPCSTWGDITEERAKELIKLNIDSKIRMVDLPNNGTGLMYNNIAYRIQPFNELKLEIKTLVKELLLAKERLKDPIAYIEKESIQGDLDFNLKLEKESPSSFIYDNVFYSKKDFAIFLWGKAVASMDALSSKEAVKLWTKIHKRKLTKIEKKTLIKGFNSK